MNINVGGVGAFLLILGMVSGGASGAPASGASRHVVAIDPKAAGLVKQAGSELKLDQYDAAIRNLTAALNMKPVARNRSSRRNEVPYVNSIPRRAIQSNLRKKAVPDTKSFAAS